MKKFFLVFSITLVLIVGALAFAQKVVAFEGDCDCELIPTNMVIARGTKLEFDVTVTNNTGVYGTAKFGGRITKPDSTITAYIYGPKEFTLQAYGQKQAHLSHDIPSSWPVGRYIYHGYVGNYGTLYGECQFDFIIPADVPRTGQTTCYDGGLAIPCAGTGQEGDLLPGLSWPNPRFTDNGNGTVTDNLTGLTWLKDANRFNKRTWSDAVSDCNSLADDGVYLTDSSTAGDWRLPNINELESLLHRGVDYPALPNTAGTGQWSEGDPFTNVQLDYYWSSTTSPGGGDALQVNINNTVVYSTGKSWALFVWPVRETQ